MSLVYDEDLVRYFFKYNDLLATNEAQLLLLDARKKYCSELTSTDRVVDRKVLRYYYNLDTIVQKVKAISHVENRFFIHETNKPIPKEAFVLYVTLNPLDTVKAWFRLINDMNNQLLQAMKDENAFRRFSRIDVEWISALHKSVSRKLYWVIDIDRKDFTLLSDVLRTDIKYKMILETKNGFHVIVTINDKNGKLLFRDKVLDKFDENADFIELKKNPMVPVPGTLQGGFEVKILEEK